jgi:hypothetical protein
VRPEEIEMEQEFGNALIGALGEGSLYAFVLLLVRTLSSEGRAWREQNARLKAGICVAEPGVTRVDGAPAIDDPAGAAQRIDSG